MQSYLLLEKGRHIAGQVDWLTRFPTEDFAMSHPNCTDRVNCMADVLEETYDGGRAAFFQWYYLLAKKMFEEPSRSIEAFARAYRDLSWLELVSCGCAPTTGTIGPAGQPLPQFTPTPPVGGAGSPGGGIAPPDSGGGGKPSGDGGSGGGVPVPVPGVFPGDVNPPGMTIGGFDDMGIFLRQRTINSGFGDNYNANDPAQCKPGEVFITDVGCVTQTTSNYGPTADDACPPGYVYDHDAGHCVAPQRVGNSGSSPVMQPMPPVYGPPAPGTPAYDALSQQPLPSQSGGGGWGVLLAIGVAAYFLTR